MTAVSSTYPAGEPGVVDLGSNVFLRWDEDGGGFAWHHPACRAWAALRLMPDARSTGHKLVSGGRDAPALLTIEGTLLCPMGCGAHGFIRGGKWAPA